MNKLNQSPITYKLWGVGGGEGVRNGGAARIFFRYEIPCMNFSLALMSHTGEEALHSSMSKKNNFN